MGGVNKHALIDTMAISAGSLFFKKYFRDGVDSVGISEHIRAVKTEVPQLTAEQEYLIISETLAGKLESAVKLAQWKGSEVPTIIYHHGASEIPYDYGFRNIFPLDKQAIEANLILIRAPFHGDRKSFMYGMATTERWLAMLAVSVKVIEQVIVQLREKSGSSIVVSGTSLGGFIANLHHSFFNSADRYAPLLAGTAMHEAYLNSVYSKSVAKLALQQPGKIKQQFDFREIFSTQDNSNVFPLLSAYDAIIRFDVQKASYGGLDVSVIEKGHTTGALAYQKLREHILNLV